MLHDLRRLKINSGIVAFRYKIKNQKILNVRAERIRWRRMLS